MEFEKNSIFNFHLKEVPKKFHLNFWHRDFFS